MIIVLKSFTNTRGRITKIINNILESIIIRDILMIHLKQKFKKVKKNFKLYLIRFIIKNIAYNYRDSVYNYRIK